MKKIFLSLVATILFFMCGCCGQCAKNQAPQSNVKEIGIDRIFDASRTLANVTQVSDLVESRELSSKNQVYLKLENQQVIGAFKLRGAYYKMSKLNPEQVKRGVVTCSAGNHAQGVGFAADKFNIKAAIFLPAGAPQKKINAVKSYKNAKVYLVNGSFDDASKVAMEYCEKNHAVYVSPYDDLDVIAGQGTIGWEILHQLPDTDVVVVPIGGGGLIAGIASAIKALKPSCKVIGVQSIESDAMVKSLKANKIITRATADTIADGTAVKRPGDITFAICQKHVDQVVTVSESQIKDAIRVLYKKCGVTAEGAGALSVAAVMSGKISSENQKVVCVISGGNIDPELLKSIVKDKK